MKKTFVVALIAATMFTTSFAVGKASAYTAAAWCGNWAGDLCHGYFDGGDASGHTGGDLINGGVPSAVNSKNEFVNFICNNIQEGGHDRMGASMIIDEMLGGAYGNSYRHTRRTTCSGTTYNKWVALVSAYASAPASSGFGIDWSKSVGAPNRNSAYAGDIDDDVFHIDQNGGTINVISFYFPGGSFKIQRSCANLAGPTDLPQVKYKWFMDAKSVARNSAGTVIGNGNTAYVGQIKKGQTITWTHTVWSKTSSEVKSKTISGKVKWGGAKSGTAGADPAYNKRFTPGETINRTRSYTTTASDVGKTICQRINGTDKAWNDSSNLTSLSACVKVVDNVTVSLRCDLPVVDPIEADPYTNIKISVDIYAPASTSTTVSFAFSDAGGHYTTTGSKTNAAGGDYTESFTITPPADGFAKGQGHVYVNAVAGTAGPIACPGDSLVTGPICLEGDAACTPVFNVYGMPYLSAYGGDVMAGVSPDPDDPTICSSTDNANVISWNHDASPAYGGPGDYSGAGAKPAVFASGNIKGFSSGLNITNLKPAGLSFGNDDDAGIDIDGGQYGGGFSGDNMPTGCDFTDGTPQALPSSTYSNASFSGNKYYTYSGNVYISSAGIKYGSTNWGGTDDIASIPSFKLVVTGGNIYIDNDVTQLDGLYVAIPNAGNGGHIYTCATANGTPADKGSSSYDSTCSNQLTVNGAFVAQSIHFDRTHGTIGRTGQTGALSDYQTDNAAERFVYGPEMWLPNGSGDNDFNILYYQGLPPVL